MPGLLAVVVGWLAVVALVRVTHAGEVLPGTATLGASFGGLDRTGARHRLDALRVGERSATLRHDGRRYEVAAADVGFRVEATTTVDRLLAAGRDGPLDLLATPLRALGVEHRVDPAYAVDRRAVARQVAAIAEEVDEQPFGGALEIDPRTRSVTVDPPSSGVAVVRREAAQRIVAQLRDDAAAAAALPVRETSGPPATQVDAAARAAERYLAEPLRLAAGERLLTVRPRRLAAILALEAPGRRVRLGVDDAAVAALVEDLGERVDRAARDARISAPAVPMVLEEKGDLAWRPRRAEVSVRGGRPGRALAAGAAAAAIARAVRSGDHRASLDVEPVQPRISRTAARRVRDLIGTFTTRYPCCEPRVQNIQRIAAEVDGTIVAPGERFSLNAVAGERTRAGGYVPAPFIGEGNEIVPSVGGGVSQFSTTIYNAVYFAGLQIDGHQPHSLYIDRYPPGREATLDFASIDLTWTNDTEAPVLVRTAGTDTSVSVSLYGDNGGRRVRAESGPRQPIPGGDFSVTVTRIVRYADGRVARQPYTTRYAKPPE